MNYIIMMHICLNINPLHPNISRHTLYSVLYTFLQGTDKENLSNDQELLQLVIVAFILMTFMCDSVLML